MTTILFRLQCFNQVMFWRDTTEFGQFFVKNPTKQKWEKSSIKLFYCKQYENSLRNMFVFQSASERLHASRWAGDQTHDGE